MSDGRGEIKSRRGEIKSREWIKAEITKRDEKSRRAIKVGAARLKLRAREIKTNAIKSRGGEIKSRGRPTN